MTVDQTQCPRELEDSFDSCSYIEEYIHHVLTLKSIYTMSLTT
jgi:hypothetical protein